VSDLTPLASLPALQGLNCSRTQVSDLTPLASLTALQQLDCSYTQVSDLSPLASLTALQQLDCSRCRLRALPPAIRDNVSLRLIAFDAHVPGLPYGILSKDERDDCRAKVKALFDDLAKGAIDFTDLKLLLLGNGGVGKTQIARWLSGVAFDPEWNSTHGIQIFGQSQSDSITARLHLHIWDFGGQDIYHGTHSLFLRGRAVLMCPGRTVG
jgi:internalin A